VSKEYVHFDLYQYGFKALFSNGKTVARLCYCKGMVRVWVVCKTV